MGCLEMPLDDDSAPPAARPTGEHRAGRGGLLRRTIQASVLLVVAVLLCRTWCVEGLFVPLGIPSGSMAEMLLGPHCRFVCLDCGRPFVCDADVPAPGRWRVCPHCGGLTENTSPLAIVEGDRVLLLRSAFCWRRPRRWEIVVFRDPGRPRRLAVKRVVGLPGESVQLRHGDVYVNGEIQRKDLDTQREMAVLVHDASSKGSKQGVVAPRWYPEVAHSRWTRSEDGFHHPGSRRPRSSEPPAAQKSKEPVDWLVYHHRRRVGDSVVAGPVMDELSYNQWRTRRSDQTRPVGDLLLRFRLAEISGDGRLVVRATEGKDHLAAWIEPKTGVCGLRLGGQMVERGSAPASRPISETDVTFSLVDRQVVLAFGDRVALRCPLRPLDPSWRPSACPLAIGSDGLGLTLSDVQVYRDVYYARPLGVFARWGCDRPVTLGPREYFVLGDNSLISEDSRSWPTGAGVPEEWLIGKPLVVPRP